MNIFANHPNCALKAPIFERINGKDKYICHLKNKTGKLFQLLVFPRRLLVEKNDFLGKNFNDDNQKNFPTSQLFSRYCLNNTEYCTYFTRVVSLENRFK